MNVTQITGRQRSVESTEVTIKDAQDASDDEVRAFAYAAANETPGACFGARVTRYDEGVAVVSIATD